jgi:cytochrome b561
VSTETQAAPTAAEPQRFTAASRILHWLTALLIFSALFIGFVMVNSIGDYATLLTVHKALGVSILIVVVVRIVNRLTHRAPALPGTISRLERLAIAGSELALYALLLAQPLVGWAMVSAAGTPVTVFGLHLPAIAPVNLTVFGVLRDTHSVLAYLLVILVAAHISAVLVHAVTLGDGMLRRMTFRLRGRRHHATETTTLPAAVPDSTA